MDYKFCSIFFCNLRKNKVGIMLFYEKIFLLGIVFLPFIDSVGRLGFFAPMRTLTFLFTVIAMLVWLLNLLCCKNKKIVLIDERYRRPVLLFLIAVLLSGAVNMSEIVSSEFQGTYGLDRFFLSTALLCVNLAIFLFVYNVFCENYEISLYVHRAIIISFLITACYSILEITAYAGVSVASDIQHSIDFIFRGDVDYQVGYRLRSLAKEPSNFGIYSSIICPWLTYGFLQKHRKMYVTILFCTFMILFVVFNVLSVSRTSYVILTIELMLFAILQKKMLIANIGKVLLVGLLIASGVIFAVYSVGDAFSNIDIIATVSSLTDIQGSMSNIARYASQEASIGLFFDYPIFGVGYDQFPIHAVNYYPQWGYISSEVVDWSTNYTQKTVWPPAYNVFCRLLSETGIMGTMTFIMFLFKIFKDSIYCLFHEKSMISDKYFCCIFISAIGVTLSGINGSEISSLMWIIYAMLLGALHQHGRGNCYYDKKS